MKRTRHSPEQIIAKLRESDACPGGRELRPVCRLLLGGVRACGGSLLEKVTDANARLWAVVRPCACQKWDLGTAFSPA